MAKFGSCRHGWCGHGYAGEFGGRFPSFGLVCFKEWFRRDHPTVATLGLEPGWQHDALVEWNVVDAGVINHLTIRGESCHRHHPDAAHLHGRPVVTEREG